MAKKKKNKGNYNYAAAIKAGLKPGPDGHWQSIDPTTGYFLKSKQHPTLHKEIDWFKSQGKDSTFGPHTHKIVTDPTGYFGKDQLRYIPIGDFIGPSEYKYGGKNMKKIKKYDNGGDPPVKQPDYLQYKGPNYFMEGNPAYDLETYQKAITRDSTALADAMFPSFMFDDMKRLQLNRQLRNKIKPYTEAEIRDLNLVGEQYTGPAVDMNMFMQQYMDSGIDDRKYGGKSKAKSMDVDYEAEGGEVVIGDIAVNKMYNGGRAKQYKGASMYMLGGPSHAEGGIGIKMKGDSPSYVFSDKLKVGGMRGATYADMAAKFGNELDEINTMAMGGEAVDRNTAKRMRPRIMEDVKDLFDDQEEFKKENNIDQEPRQAAFGEAFAAMASSAGMSTPLAAAQFLPGLFNIGKGLFGRAPEVDLGRIQPQSQSYQDFSGLERSYMGQQDRSLAGLRAGLEGSGASGSQLRAGVQAGLSGSQANAANFFGQLAQMEAQDKRATDAFNMQQDMQAQQINAQRALQEMQLEEQMNPAPAFSQGLSQLLGTATSMSQQGFQRDLLGNLFGMGNNTTATSSFTPNVNLMGNAPTLGNIGILDGFQGLSI